MPGDPPHASTAPIVCGIDFSAESKRALLTAAAIAAKLGGPLHLVGAIEPLLTEAARLRNQLSVFLDHVTRDLREFAGTLPPGLEHVTFEASAGEPAPVLLAAAVHTGARMIVVGTRGWGQSARLFLGSTTLRLLRTTDRPVLVTDLDDGSQALESSVSRIVCGVDFSEGSLAAVAAAGGLAPALGATITLVHAVAPVTVPVGWDALVRDMETERLARATERLTEVQRMLTCPSTVRASVGSPADVLAEETRIDRQAIVAVGLRGSSRHRPGSTALRVLAVTKVPVLAVPE